MATDSPAPAAGASADFDLQALLRAQGATTLADIQEIPKQTLELCYRIGYNAFNAGDAASANRMFAFLANFDHLEPKYWLGLGASLQRLGRFDDAAVSYTTAATLAGGDTTALLHAADCLLSFGERDQAGNLLRLVLKLSGDDPTQAGSHERAEGLLALLDGSS
jgi:type III secretion system low calcium response chaperone LcrH/SycD